MADADVDAARRGAAPTFSRSRIKPVVYNTTDGKIIVEDELLNFLAVKIKTLSQDEIVVLATNNFGSESIEASKKVLFEFCPSSQRNVTHKGQQKAANNIKSCLKVLNECGDNIPRFVSHYLDELPPVSYDSLDVSNLLGRLQKTYDEVCSLKHTMQLQANLTEEFRAITVDTNRRVSALERQSLSEPVIAGNGAGDSGSAETETVSAVQGASERGSPREGELSVRRHRRSASSAICCDGAVTSGRSPMDVGKAEMALERSPGGMAATSLSTGWNVVVKKGRPVHGSAKAAAQAGPRAANGRKRRAVRAAPIVGTGAQSGIQTVKTKLVSVFASKFSPELDAETLSRYLKEKLGREVKCQKIDTVQSRFGSFKVSAECNEVAEMYKPELWPDGALVRRYYEPRRECVAGVNTAAISSGIRVLGGAVGEK